MRKWAKCVVVSLFMVTAFIPVIVMAEDQNLPKGFGLNNPHDYKEHPNLYGGIGTINYVEQFSSDDYTTLHQFCRVGVIPPKSSIGEHRLSDGEELFIILKGQVDVTVNGHTGRIADRTMIPCKLGDSVGLYNPTESDVLFGWIAIAKEKGKWNPIVLNTDLSKKNHEPVVPFPWIPMEYLIGPPPENPSPRGKGPHGGAGSFRSNLARTRINSERCFFTINQWEAAYMVMPPGTSIGYHKHIIHEEHYFMVKGRARGTVNDVTLNLKPGDCTLCASGDSHGIYIDGDEDAGVICILTSSTPDRKVDSYNFGIDLVDW
ncbi:cupin domain-containing protein [Candidatus Latescibacterota bacterium]